jgi:hypothetical protein
LDTHDSFWLQNTQTPFQNIAGKYFISKVFGEIKILLFAPNRILISNFIVAVNTYLKEYKAAMDDFNKMSGGVDIDQYDER